MRLIIWNVRGCNKPFKQKEIKTLLQTNKVDVAALLETRVKKGKAPKIVEKVNKGWNHINNYTSAENGRIWLNWNPQRVQIRWMAEHEQAIMCEMQDIQSGKIQVLIVVYALNTIEHRKQLWEFICQQVAAADYPVLVGGDFNAILSVEDRYQGNVVHRMEVEDFHQCISESGLQEIRAVGPLFTWTNNQEGDNMICSNIDRSFGSATWFSEYANVVVERIEKSISDHCPQLLRFEDEEPRKGCFKFYNVIAEHGDFEQILKENWHTTRTGCLLRDVWLQCKKLKKPLKELNARWYVKTHDRVSDIRQQLKGIQLRRQQNLTDATLIVEEKRLLGELERWSNIEERIWQQKARIDWLKLGDSNTKFFHAYARMRRNTNAIHRLIRGDGSVCLGQAQIKQEILHFYKQLMGSAADELKMVDKLIMERGPRLEFHQQQMLNAECTEQEIRDALFSMNSNKAPGIDGYNVFFFKRSWHVIGQHVVKAVQQFFFTGFLPRELNVALITLIPKTENASTVREFRPIACCTVLYKIISKILANRLKLVLESIICGNQSAFVPGRVIFDNIIIGHELIKGYNRKQISPRCMVKVDIQKAYDSVEWPFVHQMLVELGFPQRYIQWIMVCLTTVEYVVNVNGELTDSFPAKKGLRQGDPISPYLFVICMEYLHRSLLSLHQNRSFHFHPRCKRLNLIEICFADDLLLFTRGDTTSVQQLLRILDMFALTSGLKANPMKSNIYFGGVTGAVKEEILRMSGMSEGKLPFKYLGVPLSSQKLSAMQCQPLVNNILHRINGWAAKLLSYAGRLQLIKSVLFGIQTYWSQIFVLPQKVLKLVQQACRTFLWTGKAVLSKRALVAWEKIELPYCAGGLNVVNLKWWNRAAICKLLWQLVQHKDRLWIKWVHGYYVKNQEVLGMIIPQQSSWMVRKILGARDYLSLMQNGQDWMHHPSFSIKKVYKGLLGEIVRVPWAKVMCQNPVPAKYKFITWLLMHERLVTCSYLQKIGIQVEHCCCLCGAEEETLDHLFFQCSFVSSVWREVAGSFGVRRGAGSWHEERNYLLTQCTTNSGYQRGYRCMIAVLVYYIWKERNLRRMQGQQNTTERIIRQCKMALAWCGQQDKKMARFCF